nr:hypothetical protein [Tanacetum cinerariifolium]
MELYMLNRQHDRMILELVEQGPLFWSTVEEDGVTRLKKYFELSAAEPIQADYDVKATNIILQGLLSEVYALGWTLGFYDSEVKDIGVLGLVLRLKKDQERDKIGSKPDKNGKCGEDGK